MLAESTPVDKRRETVHCPGMTTRMTDARAAMFSQGINKMRARGRCVDDFAAEVLDEMNRVRAEEARLLEEVAALQRGVIALQNDVIVPLQVAEKAKDERIKELEEAGRAAEEAMATISNDHTTPGFDDAQGNLGLVLAKVSP